MGPERMLDHGQGAYDLLGRSLHRRGWLAAILPQPWEGVHEQSRGQLDLGDRHEQHGQAQPADPGAGRVEV